MNKRVFVVGHNGMVGSSIVRELSKDDHIEFITVNRNELDLLDQKAVWLFFEKNNIDDVYLAAAKVGGILANNTLPAEFVYQNLMIQCNVIHAAHKFDVQNLLFLGSSCIYPKFAEQPMSEDALLTGELEPTNEPYAIAKIAGIKLCESYNRQYQRNYRSVMPTNLYGSNDNFHENNSHVIPSLMRRIHEAKINNTQQVTIWGSGNPKREFLHVDDMASACVHVMGLPDEKYKKHVLPMLSHINIGTGIDCTIRELVEVIVDIVGFTGELVFDYSKPDGAPRKLLNVNRLKDLGWKHKIGLRDGLSNTYAWFLKHQDNYRS